jgi:hypothetical protein
LANNPTYSQWISLVGDASNLPDGVTYTFRTTFDLFGLWPDTAWLRGWFDVDNHVKAIRINGHCVAVHEHGYEDSSFCWPFAIDSGFVEGNNVLEIEVENDPPPQNRQRRATSPMLLRVELAGTAGQAE